MLHTLSRACKSCFKARFLSRGSKQGLQHTENVRTNRVTHQQQQPPNETIYPRLRCRSSALECTRRRGGPVDRSGGDREDSGSGRHNWSNQLMLSFTIVRQYCGVFPAEMLQYSSFVAFWTRQHPSIHPSVRPSVRRGRE